MWSRDPTSFFCMWIYNFSTVYWKDCSFSIEWFWHPCQKSIDCKYEDIVLDSLFCSPVCLSLCWSHSDLFTMDFEIGNYESSNVFKASLITQLVKNPPAMQETSVWFLGQEDLLEKGGLPTLVFLGLPCGSVGKEFAWQCRRPGFDPWVGKILWRRERLLTPVFWPEEFHGLCSPWGRKESDTTERLSLSLSTFSRLF